MTGTLWGYYQNKGQSLPPISERAKLFEENGLGSAASYTGTAAQNTALLQKLKAGDAPPPKVATPAPGPPAPAKKPSLAPSPLVKVLNLILKFFGKKKADSVATECPYAPALSETGESSAIAQNPFAPAAAIKAAAGNDGFSNNQPISDASFAENGTTPQNSNLTQSNPGNEKVSPVPTPKDPDDYLHVFLLVPGTTNPVNNLFDFLSEGNKDNSSGRKYWAQSFLASIDQLKEEADKANASDPNYNSVKDYDFEWSGDNNHSERVNAGKALADRVCSQFSDWMEKRVYFHLIGHSHGGNVINNFAAAIAQKKDFGGRWRVKSITYLSTPFFQKIEQPKGDRLHSDALIYNIWNRYDLTQLTIADFTIKKATSGLSENLRPLAQAIKESFSILITRLFVFRTDLENVISTWLEHEKQSLKNKIPRFDNDDAQDAALQRYQEAQRQLTVSTRDLQTSIDDLATNINTLVGELDNMLERSITNANRDSVDELSVVLQEIRSRLKNIEVSSQQMVNQAANFQLAVVITLLDILIDVVDSLADLLRDDRWIRIIALGTLNILEMFDDTLQENSHYEELKGYGHETHRVETDDAFKRNTEFTHLKSILTPKESELHENWRTASTTSAYGRIKWDNFSTTADNLGMILKALIAQIGEPSLEEFQNAVKEIQIWIVRLRNWNQTADWVPGYDGESAEKRLGRLDEALPVVLGAIDELILLGCQLFQEGSALATDNPGTPAYLAIVSHSVSRQTLHEDVRAELVSKVTPN